MVYADQTPVESTEKREICADRPLPHSTVVGLEGASSVVLAVQQCFAHTASTSRELSALRPWQRSSTRRERYRSHARRSGPVGKALANHPPQRHAQCEVRRRCHGRARNQTHAAEVASFHGN